MDGAETGIAGWAKWRQEDWERGRFFASVARKTHEERASEGVGSALAEEELRNALNDLQARIAEASEDNPLCKLKAVVRPRPSNPIYKWTLYLGDFRFAAVSDAWTLSKSDVGELTDELMVCLEESRLELYLRKHPQKMEGAVSSP